MTSFALTATRQADTAVYTLESSAKVTHNVSAFEYNGKKFTVLPSEAATPAGSDFNFIELLKKAAIIAGIFAAFATAAIALSVVFTVATGIALPLVSGLAASITAFAGSEMFTLVLASIVAGVTAAAGAAGLYFRTAATTAESDKKDGEDKGAGAGAAAAAAGAAGEEKKRTSSAAAGSEAKRT